MYPYLSSILRVLLLINLLPVIGQAQYVNGEHPAPFEPSFGKCLVFVGQDLGAVGGLDQYEDGYCDHFAFPAGVTLVGHQPDFPAGRFQDTGKPIYQRALAIQVG